MRIEFDGAIERWCKLVDVMHRLSPAAWKVITLIARDDLMRQAEELSALGALRRDIFAVNGMDTGEPTGPEERSDLTVIEAIAQDIAKYPLSESSALA